MKTTIVRAVLAAAILGAAAAPSLASQAQGEQGGITVPAEEKKAYDLIANAATVDETIAAAKAFLGKYPKSLALPGVEAAVYNKILDSPADAKRLTYIATFKQMFPTSDRGLELDRAMFDYYLKEGKLGEINKSNEAYLAKHPDDVKAHLLLLTLAVEGIKRQDGSLLQSGQTHGQRTIELFEGATRPSVFKDDAEWQKYKTENSSIAYQSFAIVYLAGGDAASASKYLEKAIAADPTKPLSYLYLANVKHNLDYLPLAEKYNKAADKNSADAKKTFDDANTALDAELLLLAKAVAYSDTPDTQPVLAQARPFFDELYKLRHGGKLDGADDMIKSARVPK